MKMRKALGVAFLAGLLLSSFAAAQSGLEEAFQTGATTKLGISDERFFVEREGDTLVLYWAGWISLVKPSDEPISVNIRYSLDPPGKWRARPRTLSLATSFERGVNSVYQKCDIAQMDLGREWDSREGVPSLKNLMEKDQMLSLRITLRQRGVTAGPSLDELDYRMSPQGYELLHAAARGNIREVDSLLQQGVPVDSANLQGWTPLMAACAGGYAEVVRLLLDNRANVVAETRGFQFSQSGNGSQVPRGMTPLFAAAYGGRPDIVKLLLNAGAAYGDAIRRLRKRGASNEDLVRLLVEKGASYDDVARRLTEQGAGRQDLAGLSARGGHADLVWRMSKKAMNLADTVERMRAAGATEEEISGRLRREGADEGDITRVLKGTCATDEDLRRCLRDRGANSEEIDRLLSDRETGPNQLRQCLRDKGATEDQVVRLTRERAAGEENIRKFLREKGSTEDQISACLREKGALPDDLVEFLVKHGGTVDAARSDKWTPLIAAAFTGNPEVVRLLMDEGANPNLTDESNYSAAALACVNGNSAAYKVLRESKAAFIVPWDGSQE